MDEQPDQVPDQETTEIARTLSAARAYLQTLPSQERQIASLAADGTPIWQIAQEVRISEAAVAHTLDAVVAAVTGREVNPVETGGLGADTDPGVTGGYDDTGFGSLEADLIPDPAKSENS